MYDKEILNVFVSKDKNRKPHNRKMEISLCSRCASVFYEMPDYRIERVYKYQLETEPCSICNYHHGYVFYVWPLPNVKNSESHICGEK